MSSLLIGIDFIYEHNSRSFFLFFFHAELYTPFSAGKTFGNQETKIVLCAFSRSIYSSPIHNLFAVSFGTKSQKHLMQLSYLLFCSIAEQSMRLQSFAQWILPIPIQPFRDPGPSRISKLRLPPGAFLPSFLSIFSPYLPLLRSFFFFFSIRASIKETRLDWKIEARLRNRASFVAEWQNEVSWSF